MFFPVAKTRRPHQAFVYPPYTRLTVPSKGFVQHRRPNGINHVVCSTAPTPRPAPSSTSSTLPEHQLAQRLASVRERACRLHTRLVFHLVNSATRQALNVLSTISNEDASPSATTARRLRRDLRAARSTIDDIDIADSQLVDSIARLQTLVDQIERNVDSDTTFISDRIQEDIEGAVSPMEDISDFAEPSESSRFLTWRPALDLRRRVSTVGQAIEGRVARFVRSDGSVDLAKLRSVVRRFLDSIGMTWMRLNGRVPIHPNDSFSKVDPRGPVNVSLDFPSPPPNVLQVYDPEIESRLRQEIGDLEKKLIEGSRKRETLIREEDQLTKLIRAREIRQMDDVVSSLRRTLAVRVLQLELEKIVVVVAEEIDSAEYDTILDQRVLVFEFGDLDERLATLDLFVEQKEALLIEDDILGELAADIQDMKMRLGLDAPLYSSVQFSWTQVKQFLTSSSRKTRDGFEFYSRGMRLFVGDLRFSSRLVKRAVLGYTPTAREIRTLRRTGRDLLTLVPFTIVLIAPLTPVGHVLIFSFLQRYWPEFFPSTFSERRQAMMKRRESYLKTLRDEEGSLDNSVGDGPGERVGGNTWGKMVRLVMNPFSALGKTKRRESSSYRGEDVQSAPNSNGVGSEFSETGGEFGEQRESDKYARKKRIMKALDDLHLAD